MPSFSFKRWLACISGAAALLLAGCQTAPNLQPPARPATAPPAEVAQPVPDRAPPEARSAGLQSLAATPRAYRESGASHLYGLNRDRIYRGRMPPMLYAVGVLDIEIDRSGQVVGLDWRRAPRHAPEVMREIERTVRAASPFPTPARLGKVVYTDVWLWHVSGRFQLDTLTEGQD